MSESPPTTSKEDGGGDAGVNVNVNGRVSAGGDTSSESSDLEDLECLNFPGDVDWSSTIVLRCDPAGCPYNLTDVVHSLHDVVRRNEVFNLGPTFLNHAFTLSFKSTYALQGFVKYMRSPRMAGGLKVKGKSCTITKVPSKCVELSVRNIPLEVDTIHLVEKLKKYGTVVKTEWVKNNFRGWFHIYTNERKFTLFLHKEVKMEDLPYLMEVKGLYGGVYVAERSPKCLDCYYSGHKGDSCKFKECLLYAGD